MNLEKRSQGGPMEPEEDLTPKGKKPVVVYIMVLFIAAFLHRRAPELRHGHAERAGQDADPPGRAGGGPG